MKKPKPWQGESCESIYQGKAGRDTAKIVRDYGWHSSYLCAKKFGLSAGDMSVKDKNDPDVVNSFSIQFSKESIPDKSVLKNIKVKLSGTKSTTIHRAMMDPKGQHYRNTNHGLDNYDKSAKDTKNCKGLITYEADVMQGIPKINSKNEMPLPVLKMD